MFVFQPYLKTSYLFPKDALECRDEACECSIEAIVWQMGRKKVTGSKATAPSLPLKPVVERGSPATTLRAAFPNGKSTGFGHGTAAEILSIFDTQDVDEGQLLCAIHVLDGRAESPKGRHRDSLRAVRSALAYFVELTSSIGDRDSLDASDQANRRSSTSTICAARVLGCLKRFVDTNNRADRLAYLAQESEDYCCVRKCHQSITELAVLLVLFNLSRSRETAALVATEELDRFLLEMAKEGTYPKTNGGPDYHASCRDLAVVEIYKESREQVTSSPVEFRLEPFRAEEICLTIDPFDWCYESLSIDLAQHQGDVFLLPVGARTLRYLLNGVSLPSDEVQEHIRRLDNRPGICRRCARAVKSTPKQKPRRLPSIFSFPNWNEDEDFTPSASLCFCTTTKQSGTDLLTKRAWTIALSAEARAHLALRSLVALLFHLPERSLERRQLVLRCGAQLQQIGAAYLQVRVVREEESGSLSLSCNESPSDQDHATVIPQLLPHQAVAVSQSVLVRLAKTASFVIHEAGARLKIQPTDKSRQTAKQTDSSIPTSSPLPSPAESLSVRLKAATANAQTELAQWEAKEDAMSAARAASERTRRHGNIRQSIGKLEQLRRSLAQGLEILRTGRTHSDPTQLFADWIRSLPTVKSRELDRQADQEMRQRMTLERQYQMDARCRREQEERAFMASNDCNISSDTETSAKADKQACFLEMQAELRSLEDTLDLTGGDERISLTKSTPGSEIERDKQLARQSREDAQQARLQRLRQQEREDRECAQMRSEDVFFALRALRLQEQARSEREREAAQLQAARARAMEMQQQKIAEMRVRELDAKRAEQEVKLMLVEDLHSRQLRFFLAEQAKLQRQKEQTARKKMQVEEQDSRWRWQVLERIAKQQEDAERKRQRAEERRARRQKMQPQTGIVVEAVAADWVQCFDDGGNVYYYNAQTGVSQWEAPA